MLTLNNFNKYSVYVSGVCIQKLKTTPWDPFMNKNNFKTTVLLLIRRNCIMGFVISEFIFKDFLRMPWLATIFNQNNEVIINLNYANA